MPLALTIFAVFIILASGSALMFPADAMSFARDLMAGMGIWWAVAARLVLAVVLWFSASASRTPRTFRVLAVLTVIGAAGLAIMGSEGLHGIIDHFASWPQWLVRIPTTLGVALGLFLLWSMFSKRADT